MLIEVEGDRIAAVALGRRARRRRDAPARADAAGPRERPLARLPPRAARAHAPRRRHVLDLARGHVRGRRAARPRTPTARSPARCSRRWRWPGSPASASSTTCTTAPAASPTTTPNAMGEALIAAAAEAGIRITLLDTCYLAGGFGRRRPRACSSASPTATRTAWAERASALRDAPHARIGAAIHSVRAVPADQLATVADWARERGAPLHVAPVRAARRERGLPRRPRPHARRSCSTSTARSARTAAWCTPPTSPTTTSRCSAAPARSACARPPSATSPTASARPARSRRRLAAVRWAATATP